MLPAQQRMRSGSDFTAAVRKGRRAGRQTLVVHLNRSAAPDSKSQPPAVVGFVVSKAIGSAVVRNRVKRRLRHLVRERLALLPAGARVVVRANPAAATTEGLAKDLEDALAAVLRADRGTA